MSRLGNKLHNHCLTTVLTFLFIVIMKSLDNLQYSEVLIEVFVISLKRTSATYLYVTSVNNDTVGLTLST